LSTTNFGNHETSNPKALGTCYEFKNETKLMRTN
jgi:hypothetical protein